MNWGVAPALGFPGTGPKVVGLATVATQAERGAACQERSQEGREVGLEVVVAVAAGGKVAAPMEAHSTSALALGAALSCRCSR
jgi:hypothetical protein